MPSLFQSLASRARDAVVQRPSRLGGVLTNRAFAYGAARRARFSVRWDGEDWVHRWGEEFIAYPFPTLWALEMPGKHIPLWTASYRPQYGDTVVDLGAGIGTEVSAWSRLVGGHGLVIAVEADPVACRRLRKLVVALNLTNVKVVETAISEVPGFASFSQGSREGQENRILNNWSLSDSGDKPGAIEVPVTTMDRLCTDLRISHIDYLKMNIEGSEVGALNGMTEVLPTNICVSCHDFLGVPEMATKAEVLAWLGAHDYRLIEPTLVDQRPSNLDTVFAVR